MADFTGMTVKVTLRQPQDAVLYGKVVEVVKGQTLSLTNVVFEQSRARWEHLTVPGTAIADLEVVNAITPGISPVPTPQQPQDFQQFQAQMPPPIMVPRPQPPSELPTDTPSRATSSFVDPAILSYRASPVQTRAATRTAPPPSAATPATPTKTMLARAAETLPQTSSSPFVGEPKSLPIRQTSKDASTSASLTKEQLQPTKQESADGVAQEQVAGETVKKKVRRGQKKKAVATPVSEAAGPAPPPPQIMNTEVSRNGNDMNGTVKRGKGWRSTPLLQPLPHSHAGNEKVRQQSGRQRREAEMNGWATEDATDVQDMGEFDFEANHKLFDKKAVFEELRAGDTTADEDRLVSHNRHRPGTHGGKNLHPTENVLSPKVGSSKYGSQEIEMSSDADTELNFTNGRSSSRHSLSRASLKKQASRQGSYHTADIRPHPLSASISSDKGLGAGKTIGSIAGRAKQIPSNTTSPMPDRTQSPHSALSGSRRRESPAQMQPHAPEVHGPHFLLQGTGGVCPGLHPAALDTLELETASRYGVSHDAITESAARAIAETALDFTECAGGMTSRRGSRANTFRGNAAMTSARGQAGQYIAQQQPVIVILAGDHLAGARAMAAARHLASRQCKVIISEGPFKTSEVQNQQLQAQNTIVKRLQRGGANIKRGPWTKAIQYIKQLSGPPAIIIDALLAGTTYESLAEAELVPLDATSSIQRETRDAIDWANRSRAPVLSIACPSGVSGVDGSTTVVEGEPLAVRPDKVLALGMPMLGLLEAMKGGERWDVALADVGLNITLRSDEVVVFGSKWVRQCEFVDDAEGLDEVAGAAVAVAVP